MHSLENLKTGAPMIQWLPTVNCTEMTELRWHATKGRVQSPREMGMWVCSVQTCSSSETWFTVTEMYSLSSEGQKSKLVSLGGN